MVLVVAALRSTILVPVTEKGKVLALM